MRPNWSRVVLTLLVLGVTVALVWTALVLWSGATKQPLPLDDQCVANADGYTATVTLEQAHNAAIISAVGLDRGLPARAVTIALATAFQESGIRNLDYGHADSIGLFQQRPSKGWGTVKQIMDPYYSSGKFFSELVRVKNWRTDDINDVAQKVQRSAYPDAYRKHVNKARALAAALTGIEPAGLSCKVGARDRADPAGLAKLLRTGLDNDATVTRKDAQLIIEASTPQRAWAAAAMVVANTGAYGVARVAVGGADWAHDNRSLASWTGIGNGRIVTVTFRT